MRSGIDTMEVLIWKLHSILDICRNGYYYVCLSTTIFFSFCRQDMVLRGRTRLKVARIKHSFYIIRKRARKMKTMVWMSVKLISSSKKSTKVQWIQSLKEMEYAVEIKCPKCKDESIKLLENKAVILPQQEKAGKTKTRV